MMNVNRSKGLAHRVLVLFCCSSVLCGKGLAQSDARQRLPDAPGVRISEILQASLEAPVAGSAASSKEDDAGGGERPGIPRLTRSEAEAMAIKKNPTIAISKLLALAQHQVVRESRSAELPTATASISAVESESGSRLSAGSLTSSSLLEHVGAGGGFSQLVADFGRTRNLVASSKLQEKAQNASAEATTEDIVLATDQAFYSALEAQALFQVATQNVRMLQTTDAQVSQLTKSKLKSQLDLSFSDVNLSRARLLLLDAQNNLAGSMASLDAVLGQDKETDYDLIDDATPLAPPATDVESLIQEGLTQRPDLQALDFGQKAAIKLSHAQRDQKFPAISVAGTAGSVPIRTDQYTSNWWGAVGINMNVPLFNGFLYSAQEKEASIRAQAAGERSRELRDSIVRDIRTSWLSANTAYQRMSVAKEMLDEANQSLRLAQTRYQMGLSSIVELSQAQYAQTDAAIGNTNAQYQYRLALATLNYEVGVQP